MHTRSDRTITRLAKLSHARALPRALARALARTLTLALPAATSLLATPAAAQCDVRWLPLPSPVGLGTNGQVNATIMWDPDGAGPAAPELVVAGSFTTAGGVTVNRIARWNGSAWSAFGSGMSNQVYALAVLPNGDLVAAGQFITSGGVTTNRIARWNGSVWSSFGSGTNNTVYALAVFPNGDLVAGGQFFTAGGVTVNNIARWDGSAWSAMGSGMNNAVNALTVLPNGDLVAGGAFTSRVARWSDPVWSPIGSMPSGTVNTLIALPSGDLVAGGTLSGLGNIGRWNGSAWSAIGGGMNNAVNALTVLPNGDLVAGGQFNIAGGTTVNAVARWNGAAWSAFGSGVSSTVRALAVLPNGDLVAGGQFFMAGGVGADNITRWTLSRIVVADHPDPVTLDEGQTITLSAAPGSGLTGVSVQWLRNGVNITSGPDGASPGGGTVTGASGPLPATLTITNAQPGDSGNYTAVFTNECGSGLSLPATVIVNGTSDCPADFNADGFVDDADFIDFAAAYEAFLCP